MMIVYVFLNEDNTIFENSEEIINTFQKFFRIFSISNSGSSYGGVVSETSDFLIGNDESNVQNGGVSETMTNSIYTENDNADDDDDVFEELDPDAS